MNYVNASEARNYFHINATTLKKWKDEGRIKFKKFSSKKFLYDIDSFETEDSSKQRKNVIYARVSNTKQFNDLQTQIEILKHYCLSKGIDISDVYKDIASGMNENRKEFNLLIDDVIKGNVKTVYITFKDRLTRFGFEYFKNLFGKFGTEIVVIDFNEESSSLFQTELTNDLISIIHHFSMKLYSNRRKKFKQIESILENDKKSENNPDK